MKTLRSSPTRRTILVVDDDADVRDTLSDLLESEGYRVATAADGEGALEWLEREPPPALILLDLMMPRVSGTAVCMTLRNDPRLSAVPLIITSAIADHPDVKGLVDHAVAIMPKPFDLARLLELTEDHLECARC